jgi:arabinan endo-1,5-alpha-L-arabinosidase
MNLFFKPPALATYGIFLLLWAATTASAAIPNGSIGTHDPSRMINCNGTYYVYSTGGGMMHSTDRITWTSGTSPFPNGVPASVASVVTINQGIWAPDVIFYNNQYYLYYAVADPSSTNSAIGLLTSPTLNTSASNYKWTDAGMVVHHHDKPDKETAIDPCPFLDTSNNLWLSWGSGYADGATYADPTIFIIRLNNTTGLASTTDSNEYPAAEGHIEASYVHYHDGYYYAFWNSGGCCDGTNSTYTIHMARSLFPTGPYVARDGGTNVVSGDEENFLGPTAYINPIDGYEYGPGQIGILSEGGIDHFTYHYYPNSGSILGEETLLWGPDGWPVAGADLAPGTYKINSLNTGLVMGIYQAGTTNGTPLDQEPYTGAADQQWTVSYTTNGSAADGYYRITSAGSGMVVDLYQSNTNNGTLIDQWPWGNGNNQRWFIEQTSEGYYRMVSRVSQSVIGVTNFSSTTGTWLDESVWTNVVNQQWVIGTTTGTPPAVPTGLVAAPGIGQVALSWTAVSGATSYDVKRGTASGGPYATSLGNPTSANFTDTSVTNGMTYYYSVSAVNASGVSAKSSPANATLGGVPVPSGLVATAGNGQVSLTWTALSGVTGYNVKRSTVNGGPFTTTNASPSSANYADNSVIDGTTYYYVVSALTLTGESTNSTQASATPTAAIPAPVAGSVNLNWAGNANASWDVNTTSNWLVSGITAPSTVFSNGDSVNFDDTSSTTAIGLTGSVQPYLLTVNAAQNYAFNGGAGGIAGAALLVKCGNGNLTLNGTNTFSGGISIHGGSLILGSVGANLNGLGTGPVTFLGGTLQFNGYGGNGGTDWGGCTNPFVVPAGQTGTLLLPPRFSYGTAFTSALTGAGTLNLTVDYIRCAFNGNWSAFTGQINVSPLNGMYTGGDFRVNNASGYASAALYLNSGVNFYNINANNQTTDLGELGGAGGAFLGNGSGQSSNPTWRIGAKNTTNTFAGTVVDSGTTSLTKIGTGTLILTGPNTYSGPTTISGGILQIGAGGNTGTLGAGNVTDSAMLIFNRYDNFVVSNTISGNGSLVQAGSGVLTLNAANTWSGATFVSAGTLALTNSASLANSTNINLANGALFDVSGTTSHAMTLIGGKMLSGDGFVNGGFTLASGATLAPGNNDLGALVFSNSLTLNSGSKTILNVSRDLRANNSVNVSGAFALNGSLIVSNVGDPLQAGDLFQLFGAGNFSGNFSSVTLPVLTPGLYWNINALAVSGIVSVGIETPPIIGSIGLTGGNLVLSGGGGITNGTYYVLTSTNLGAPTSSWTRLLTNQFDAGGNFNFTNALNPSSAQGYYLLQLP